MIQDFLSSFTDELAKPSRFQVNLNLPPILQQAVDSRTMSLRCESAVLPGRTLATSDLRIYGPSEKFPYQSTYEDVSLTFIVTGSMIEKTLFDNWLNQINPQNSWNFNFKSDYVTDISITQYDQADNEIHIVNLVEAFPISVNQLDLDWGSDAPYHKLTVTFAYTYWEVQQTATVNHVLGAAKNAPFNLTSALQIGALALSSGKALTNGNPYALLSVAGAATSIIPSLGQTSTLSSILNNSGRGALDTALDQGASKVNLNKQSISGLTSKPNKFSF
jgi:hypothetical protein